MNVSASIESHRNLSIPLARRTHRSSAVLLGTFGVLHLCNHPVVAAGPGAHQAVMEALRYLYRTPVAELLLQTGLTRFVLLKSALVGMALLVLCIHKNFKVARVGMWTAAGAYTLLIAYHLALFCV